MTSPVPELTAWELHQVAPMEAGELRGLILRLSQLVYALERSEGLHTQFYESGDYMSLEEYRAVYGDGS